MTPEESARFAALAKFARWAVIEGLFDGMNLDGGDIQECAEKLGLIVKVAYDPVKHGESDDADPGDPWYEFAPWLKEGT